MFEFMLYEYLLDELEALTKIIETRGELDPAGKQIQEAYLMIIAIHAEHACDNENIPLEFLDY